MNDYSDIPPLPIHGHRIDVLENAFSWYIRILEILVSRDLDGRMAGIGIAKGKGKITTLLLIDGYPGIRPSAIADILLMDRPAMGRILHGMEKNGLILRATDPNDMRAQSLSITPAGSAMAQNVRRVIAEQEAEFFDFIPRDDREQFMRILKRAYTRMCEKMT